jgi:soluble lytic murein transglycosylase-like protein
MSRRELRVIIYALWLWLGIGVGILLGSLVKEALAQPAAAPAEVSAALEAGIADGLPRDWALRVAWCESRWDPRARNRWTGAAGLYQFVPRTWAATPQGQAGMSPYDAEANARAAAWLYARSGGRPWVCR